MKRYKTIEKKAQVEFKVKKSRFISYMTPVDTKEKAEEFIDAISKKNHDATHNVPVYIIGAEGSIEKYSDDGEPAGTAGLPVLEMFRKENLSNIAIVITRYFGGTKLGTGGLVRAYTKSAKMALESANVIEKREYIKTSFTLDYTLHGKINNYILNNSELILHDTKFTDEVELIIYVNPASMDKFKKDLQNFTNGQVTVDILEKSFLTFSNNKYIKER